MIVLTMMAIEGDFKLAQAFAIRKLSKQHCKQMSIGIKAFAMLVGIMSLDNLTQWDFDEEVAFLLGKM